MSDAVEGPSINNDESLNEPLNGPLAEGVQPPRDGAYEIKFLLEHSIADEILDRARAQMPPDPNSDPRLVDRYQINSLYFDNDQFGVFRRLGSYRRRKFRLRRYGDAATVFLERKSKSKGIVRKRRTLVPDSELDRILAPTTDAAWSGHWFHRRIAKRGLRPTCHISYERVARVDMSPEGPIRLTVDRNVLCTPASDVCFPCLDQGNRLLSDLSILELKFRTVLPPFFNTLVRDFGLVPTSVSKYRLGVVACGLHRGVFDNPSANGEGSAGEQNENSQLDDGNRRTA